MASFSPMPVFQRISQYIVAALAGPEGLFHLVSAIFIIARTAVRTLADFYRSRPGALTLDNLARLNYCTERLQSVLYTLRHAPERFLNPSQLRPLLRHHAVLSHICHESLDFSPLYPQLTAPAAAPHLTGPQTQHKTQNAQPVPQIPQSEIPQSSIRNPQSEIRNPQLLSSPGRTLATILGHLGALYGIRPSRVPLSPASPPPASDPPPHISQPSPSPTSTVPTASTAPADPPPTPPESLPPP